MTINRFTSVILLIAIMGTVITPCNAETVRLSERTPVKLRLLEELTSGKAKVGEAVSYEVREDIKDTNGRLLVAEGASALGKVTESKKRGMMGKQGKLEFTVESMEAVDGTRVPLRASVENSGKSNKGVVIASALLLTVLAVFVHGKDVTVEEGTELVAYVDRDVDIIPSAVAINPRSQQSGTTVLEAQVSKTPSDWKLVILSNLLAGTNVVGELRNDGQHACAAEVVALIHNDGKLVGAGTVVLDVIAPNEQKAFVVPIQGSTDGVISLEANPKNSVITPDPGTPANAGVTVES